MIRHDHPDVYKPCIIIPVYNHGATLKAVLDELQKTNLPVILIDDGSEHICKQQIQSVQQFYNAQREGAVTLFTRATNGGKGAAIKDGIREAQARGFTHALQVDADGQHDLSKAQDLLHLAQTWPRAMISAQPIFGSDAPLLRVYTRYTSHILVWIETWSFEISESMCGFRVYPVAETSAVINTCTLGNRMSFDTEIMVRLHWRGLPAIMCPVEVHYPEHGISHFRIFHDNMHHLWMHVKLMLLMLLHLPQIIKNKVKKNLDIATNNDHWSRQNERGSSLGLQATLFAYRFAGLRMLQALLLPVTVYFYFKHHSARRASQDFLRRVQRQRGLLGLSPISVSGMSTFRHMYAFSLATFEKVKAWQDEKLRLPIHFPNRNLMLALEQSGRGALIMCSHLGYNDLIRAVTQHVQHAARAPVNILVYHQHALKYNALIKKVNPKANVNLIYVQTIIPEIAILLKQKVEDGELVFVAGDRTSPERHGRDVRIPFLGELAAFPHGPAVLAHVLECPVYFFFCLKINNAYHIHFEKYAERLILPRKQRDKKIEAFMRSFVLRLERIALHHPYQWFNFYDFWEK